MENDVQLRVTLSMMYIYIFHYRFSPFILTRDRLALTKFDLLMMTFSSGWRRLPRGTGENACEAHATVRLGEGRGLMTIVNVHLGNEGSQDNVDQVWWCVRVFSKGYRHKWIQYSAHP